MIIPEELLKSSSRELDSILSPDIFKATYLLTPGNKIATKTPAGKQGFSIVTGEDFCLIVPTKNLYLNYKPLLRSHLADLIKQKIELDVDKFTPSSYMKLLKKLAVNMYGEDSVDYDLYARTITIHFPETTIRNSIEMEHIMRDIYIRLSIDNKNHLVEIAFARTTATERELRNSYLFSHTNNSTLGSFTTDLCLGDSPLASLFRKLRRGEVSSIQNFTALLYLINDYLSWESLEGVPYVYMENVLNDKANLRDTSIPRYNCSFLLKRVASELPSFSYDYVIEQSKSTVILQQDEIARIDEILTKAFPEFCYPLQNGRSIQIVDSSKNHYFREYDGTLSQVVFKGNPVYNKVIPESVEITPVSSMYIHRNILETICKHIQRMFTQYLLNRKINE